MTFSPPELFRRMHADGVCSYGATYEEWLATWKQRALHDPPALLMAVDFEWMSLADIQRWERPDYWLPEHSFAPFGKTAGGDLYAWYPAWTEHNRTPIVLAHRDVSTCEVLAPDLEAFLYRQLLEAPTFADDPDGLTPDEARQAMRAGIDVLRPYVRARWIADLEAAVAHPLDEAQLDELLAREIGFPRFGLTFAHLGV